MSKQPNPPPPGDKPVNSAPPPPPGWRHWLWPIALLAFFALFFILPGINIKTPESLSYSQFTSQVSAHKIKTVVFASGSSGANTSVSGELTNGKSYQTVIPGSPTTTFTQQLKSEGVKTISADPPSSGLGSDLL
jgi:cell division protease FtsH